MMINLLEGSLQIDIFYDCEDQDLEDNICVRVVESCPPVEKVMRAGETYLYLTPDQARELGQLLLDASDFSETEQPE
jgi:hypothetical protein